MFRKVKRSIKNATCFDWAYVCVNNKGECKNCAQNKNGKCAFANKEMYKNEIFETRICFSEYQEEMLLNYFWKIIEKKENENNNRK